MPKPKPKKVDKFVKPNGGSDLKVSTAKATAKAEKAQATSARVDYKAPTWKPSAKATKGAAGQPPPGIAKEIKTRQSKVRSLLKFFGLAD